jgi:hypothetical protein
VLVGVAATHSLKLTHTHSLHSLALTTYSLARFSRSQGEPYLAYANSRFAGWPFATGMLTFFASGYCVQTTLPRLLCRLPGHHESSWVYCDAAFDAAVQAYNATSALLGNSTS